MSSSRPIQRVKEAWQELAKAEREYAATCDKIIELQSEEAKHLKHLKEKQEIFKSFTSIQFNNYLLLETMDDAKFYKNLRDKSTGDFADFKIACTVSHKVQRSIQKLLDAVGKIDDAGEPPFKRDRRNEIDTGHYSLKKDLDVWDDWNDGK